MREYAALWNNDRQQWAVISRDDTDPQDTWYTLTGLDTGTAVHQIVSALNKAQYDA